MLRDQRTTLSFTKEGKDLIKRLASSQGISQAVYLELLARKDAEEQKWKEAERNGYHA